MTRYMYDALYPAGIPLDIPAMALVASYTDHPEVHPPCMDQLAARFPHNRLVTIAAHGGDAQCCDVETGAMNPADVPLWLIRQRARGVTPWCYATNTNWALVLGACQVRQVAPPLWWLANWDIGPVLRPGTIGTQYAHPTGYDLSVMLDHIPGFDPDPPAEDDLMIEMIRMDPTATPPGNGAVVGHLGGGICVPVAPQTYATWQNLGRPTTQMAPGPFADYLQWITSGATADEQATAADTVTALIAKATQLLATAPQ